MNEMIFSLLRYQAKKFCFASFNDSVASGRYKTVAEQYVKHTSYRVEHRNFAFDILPF